MQVFLDLQFEPDEDYLKKLNNYNRLIEFLNEKSDLYSLPKNPEELNLEQEELILEIFQNESDQNDLTNFEKPLDLNIGRLIIELDYKNTPKTCENFKCLITGEKGLSKKAPFKPLYYKNNYFHRIITNWIAQTGDITRFDGSGGESIYGGKFNDEKLGLSKKFSKGSIAMANSGKNSNTSQFFLLLSDKEEEKIKKLLNGKYVIFGQIISDMKLLDVLNDQGTLEGIPKKKIIIKDCGIL